MLVKFKLTLMAQTVDMPEPPGNKAWERSCKGALHLKPGTVRDLTQDEVEHIKKSEPAVAKCMTELPTPASPPAAKKSTPKTGTSKAKAPAKKFGGAPSE